ncbi:hypothetical protein HDU90_005615 [Geranomyces variabilis]|nr:hypothetical protein HDU90_005615 [Geranomyces variabilis]
MAPAPAALAQGGWGRMLLSVGGLEKLWPATIFSTGSTTGDLATTISPPNALRDHAKGTPISPAVRDHLHATFRHVAGSLGLTAAMIFGLYRVGAALQIMEMN